MNHKIVVCEDHPIYAQGILDFLKKHFSIAGVFNNGLEVLNFIVKNKADILLLDLNLPGINGIEVVQELKRRNHQIKIVVISMYNDKMLIDKCKKLGVHAFCNKQVSNSELLMILNNLKKGEFLVDDSIKKRNEKKLEKKSLENFEIKSKLTDREIELIELFSKGLSSKEIAFQLNVSYFTVDTHKKNIFKKMNINSTVELVKFYYENI
jgi:two-component system nitrate/nitrite response regulator NarL